MTAPAIPTVKLSNGVEMPQIGYGVFQIPPAEAERCVADALRAGYRMIDTAQAYRNEEGVGAAVAKSGLKRGDVFLVSKVWISNYGDGKTAASLDASLRKLGTDYIDLMLLHQPFCDRYGAWRDLEKAYKAGKVRAIGVSNFFADHIVDLAANNEVAPMVDQMETHVFQQQAALRPFLDELGCRLMAWGPLAEGKNGIFTHPVLSAIGGNHGKSAAQVALRFLLEKGVVIIPKSSHPDRMAQNLDILDFSLSPAETAAIAALDTGQSLLFDHHDGAAAKQFMAWRGLV
jgi:diketogulonate reductase-like aldo/keto reductase